MKRIAVLLAPVVLLSACATTPTVHTDYDPEAAFSSYRTYAWRQQPQLNNPLVRQRLIAAIESELRAKGWEGSYETVKLAVRPLRAEACVASLTQ